jgi:hypothetical protein
LNSPEIPFHSHAKVSSELNLRRVRVGHEKSQSELQILFSRIPMGEPRGIGYAFEVPYTSDSSDNAGSAGSTNRAKSPTLTYSKVLLVQLRSK